MESAKKIWFSTVRCDSEEDIVDPQAVLRVSACFLEHFIEVRRNGLLCHQMYVKHKKDICPFYVYTSEKPYSIYIQNNPLLVISGVDS